MNVRTGRELYTRNDLTIHAPAQTVYELAADVCRWPRLLSHYRYVRVLSEDGIARQVEMGASRSGIPVRWTALQRLDPSAGRITYEHTHGVTRGMHVEWRIEARGTVSEVSIQHWLSPMQLWLKLPPSQFVVGRLFVMHIADKTLRGVARHAELESGSKTAP